MPRQAPFTPQPHWSFPVGAPHACHTLAAPMVSEEACRPLLTEVAWLPPLINLGSCSNLEAARAAGQPEEKSADQVGQGRDEGGELAEGRAAREQVADQQRRRVSDDLNHVEEALCCAPHRWRQPCLHHVDGDTVPALCE